MKLLSIFLFIFLSIFSHSYAYEMPSSASLKGLSVSHTSFDFNSDFDGRVTNPKMRQNGFRNAGSNKHLRGSR